MLIDLTTTEPPASWGVEIDVDAVDALAGAHADHHFARPAFDYPGLPDWRGEHWARLAILGTSVMACLWPPDGAQMWTVTHQQSELSDAPAVWACVVRADPHGVELESMTEVDGAKFFAGRGHLQLIAERETTLRAVAKRLLDRFEGRAMRLVEESGRDAPKLAGLLIEELPGFQDRPETVAGTLPFDKLAHLAVAVMAARIPGIRRLHTLPVYPDYMLPMVLRYHGILRYAPDLAEAIDSRALIRSGDPHELAIRWATVRAAALLEARLHALGNPVETPSLDYWLWSSAVLGEHAGQMGEHHRTVTMAY